MQIVDLDEYDKMKPSLKLMAKLEEGEHSVCVEGWLSVYQNYDII